MTVPASAKPFYDSFVEAVDGYFWRIVLRPDALDELIGLGYRYEHIPENAMQLIAATLVSSLCGCRAWLQLCIRASGILLTTTLLRSGSLSMTLRRKTSMTFLQKASSTNSLTFYRQFSFLGLKPSG